MDYYPLIRGRQYDLLALQACLKTLSPHIKPIIEPVKDIAALPRTVTAFAKAAHPLYLIANPQVGQYGLLASPKHALPALLPAPVATARYFDPYPAALTLTQTKAQVQLLTAEQLAVIPNAARMRAVHHPRAIYLEDHYPQRDRTEGYYTVQDELYQYPLATLPGVGFADYPLSTRHYSDTGYPQRAIALHLLYPRDNMLWLHHFVSVNNAAYHDPGTKFFEALSPIHAWLATQPQAATPALTQLLTLDHFPGLGTVRKLQLMHWLTIVDRWLTA